MSEKIRVKDNNYITINGWMRNIPEIETNTELMAYALIYGFSQTEGQYFTCKQSYIAGWLGITRYNCNRLLSRMEKKKLIKRILVRKSGAMKQYKYSCILPDESECQNGNRTSAKTATVASAVTAHNNNNIYNNILYISNPEKYKKSTDQYNAIQFNQFPQRDDYDFEQLEMELLEVSAANNRECK